tara:strand:- start:4457 stop:5092 length:636 start_codon:yes stop_codon:yes gene_type:complete
LIKIDIFSDTICPWCYIGKKKLEKILTYFPNCEFKITWRPFQLNPDMPNQGIKRLDYLVKKFGSIENANEVYNSINHTGKNLGIFFQFNKIKKTPNSFASHKLLALGHKQDKQNEIIESIFYAYFIEGKDIGNQKELIKIGKQHNLNELETKKYINSNEDKLNLLNEEIQAKKMGIKGVPCFIINKEYVIFGVQEENKFINLFKNLINNND